MNNVEMSPIGTTNLIDFSMESEVAYWASKLNVRPEVMKTAARACCSNAVAEIKEYLKARQTMRKRRRPLL